MDHDRRVQRLLQVRQQDKDFAAHQRSKYKLALKQQNERQQKADERERELQAEVGHVHPARGSIRRLQVRAAEEARQRAEALTIMGLAQREAELQVAANASNDPLGTTRFEHTTSHSQCHRTMPAVSPCTPIVSSRFLCAHCWPVLFLSDLE